LKKGVSESEASSVVGHLKEMGLLDDRSFAEALKREALKTKLLSLAGAKRYMLKRGIPREIVADAFSGEDTDVANAQKIVDKKKIMLQNYSSEVAKRRLYNLLCRRGYSAETIAKVLRENNFREDEE